MKANLFTGEELKNKGMQRATDNANVVVPNWSDQAYNFLCQFIQSQQTFMTEDIRTAASGIVPKAPSARAWGSVVVRAKKAGLIIHDGYGVTKNPKAHCTPAAVWRVL